MLNTNNYISNHLTEKWQNIRRYTYEWFHIQNCILSIWHLMKHQIHWHKQRSNHSPIHLQFFCMNITNLNMVYFRKLYNMSLYYLGHESKTTLIPEEFLWSDMHVNNKHLTLLWIVSFVMYYMSVYFRLFHTNNNHRYIGGFRTYTLSYFTVYSIERNGCLA